MIALMKSDHNEDEISSQNCCIVRQDPTACYSNDRTSLVNGVAFYKSQHFKTA